LSGTHDGKAGWKRQAGLGLFSGSVASKTGRDGSGQRKLADGSLAENVNELLFFALPFLGCVC
jgi:hypothetical protein